MLGVAEVGCGPAISLVKALRGLGVSPGSLVAVQLAQRQSSLGNIGAMKEWGEVRQSWGTCKALKGDGPGLADFVVGVAEKQLLQRHAT